MSTLQVGIRLHDMGHVSLEQRLVFAHEQGFRCVHLASKLIYSEYGIDYHGLTPGLAYHLRKECEKNDLDIAVYGCYLNLANPKKEKLEQIIEEYKANIRFASYMGASIVGTETGAPNESYSFCPECHEEKAFLFLLKNLKEVVDYAASFGITIAIEPVWRHIIYNPKRARQALDHIHSPNLQIIFDPVNLLCAKNHKNQQEIFKEMLSVNGNDIVVLHAKDYDIGSDDVIACAPGTTGNLDYTEIIRWQKEQKPYLQATIENSTPLNAVTARKFLEKL